MCGADGAYPLEDLTAPIPWKTGLAFRPSTAVRVGCALFGFDLDQRVREAIIGMPESAWIKAIRADGSERERSQVCEITDRLDLLLAGGLAADRPAHEGSSGRATSSRLRTTRLPPGGVPHRSARRLSPCLI